MDLRTYAISQKLKQNSDLWLYIADGRDVPISVVESAFSKILNDTNDLEAERLANDYDSYVTNHIPLTVSPLDGGAQINGELDDRALDVIQHFYNFFTLNFNIRIEILNRSSTFYYIKKSRLFLT